MAETSPLQISKVVLINLPEEGQCADFYTPKYAIDDFSVYPPLGLLYVATVAKKHYPVEIMDVVARRYGIEETVREVVSRNPTVLGISSTTFRIYPMAEIIRGVKERLPDVVIVVGGPHTSLYPAETLNLHGVDYVIVGDGEKSFKMLLDALSSGDRDALRRITGIVYREDGSIVQVRPDRSASVEGLPIPDWGLLDYAYYYTAADKSEQTVTMISSRGCPFKCNFCDVMEKNYRWRPANDIVDEMEHIVKHFSNPVIHVFDDTFNILRGRVFEICDEIKKRGLKIKWTTRARCHPLDEEMVVAMKEAGLKRIHFGLESGSEVTLKNIKKGITKSQIISAFNVCKKHKIETLAYFIVGFDWETKKDINATIEFIREIRPNFIMANTLYPAAKTEIYNDLLSSGKIKTDLWQEFAERPVPNFILPKWQNKATRNYLKRKLDEIYLTFYLSPYFVFNNVKSDATAGFSLTGLLFKVNLARLILQSYLTSLASEKLSLSGERNEMR